MQEGWEDFHFPPRVPIWMVTLGKFAEVCLLLLHWDPRNGSFDLLKEGLLVVIDSRPVCGRLRDEKSGSGMHRCRQIEKHVFQRFVGGFGCCLEFLPHCLKCIPQFAARLPSRENGLQSLQVVFAQECIALTWHVTNTLLRLVPLLRQQRFCCALHGRAAAQHPELTEVGRKICPSGGSLGGRHQAPRGRAQQAAQGTQLSGH
mmetsp:Transcript_4065/g.9768  ORF Transcript_4065/g.9768 Transcript_4065/m.9768 type:complete len:203 (-) Transcript_4065:405-1013(-)